MLSLVVSNFPYHRKWIYFSDCPTWLPFHLNFFKNSSCREDIFGFKRETVYTKIIDIANEQLYDSIGRHNHHKMNNARDEGVTCHSTDDIQAYISFHGKYIYNKKYSGSFSEREMRIYGGHLQMRMACDSAGRPLVYHTYLVDRSIGKVRILTSVSIRRDENLSQQDKNLIANANRLLHYEDMVCFRDLGFTKYDFGGYAYGTKDKSLAGINFFKDSFGGELVEESNYEPWLVWVLKKVKSSLSGHR